MLTPRENAMRQISLELVKRPEFSIVPPAEIELSVGKMLAAFEARFFKLIDDEHVEVPPDRIDAAIRDSCTEPLATKNTNRHFTLTLKLLPDAVTVTQLRETGGARRPRFRFLFNPLQIEPYVLRSDMLLKRKPKEISMPDMLAAAKNEQAFAALAARTSTSNLFNRVMEEMTRLITSRTEPGETERQDALTLLNALETACKADESLGDNVQKQYLRTLTTVRESLTPNGGRSHVS